jgi:hypothetical protein
MAHMRAFLLCYFLSYLTTAAVTVIPLTLNIPKPYESTEAPVTSDNDLLSKLHAGAPLDSQASYSSYTGELFQKIPLIGVYSSQDSFVRGTIDASAKHQHLVIQPQDVWLTILTQLSFYLRKHKDDEEVAEIWDNLEGEPAEPMWSLWMQALDTWVRDQFNRRSRASWLLDWVRPNFTAASSHPHKMVQNSSEEMLANALMMASPSPSSEDLPAFPCKIGLPSITLNGRQDDWKNIVSKVNSLGMFGREPKVYGRLLHTVLSRFVQTFDQPNDPTIRLFWNNIITATARHNLCNTTELITGWINAFHMWDPAGNLAVTSDITVTSEAVELDGITFPWRHCEDTPIANSYAPMCTQADSVAVTYSPILVGMLAKSVKQGKPEGYEAAMKLAGFTLPSSVVESDHSILQPLPIWISHEVFSVSSTSVYLYRQCIRRRTKLTNSQRAIAVRQIWHHLANAEILLPPILCFWYKLWHIVTIFLTSFTKPPHWHFDSCLELLSLAR